MSNYTAIYLAADISSAFIDNLVSLLANMVPYGSLIALVVLGLIVFAVF